MQSFRSMIEGLRRAAGSPSIVLWLWAVNLVLALPAAWAMATSLHDSTASRLATEGLRTGFDMTWFGEYADLARGIERTFTPAVAGAGAFYANLEGWISDGMFREPPAVVGLGLLQALVWALLLGGIVHRFRRPVGGFRLSGFLRSGGRYFFRFVRLMVLSGVLYYLVYRLAGWASGSLASRMRDVTSERTVLWATLAMALGTVLLLALVHMVFAFAKIATVVENRRSMLLAVLRGLGFVLSNPGKVAGLYAGMGLLWAALLAGYAWLAPGVGQQSWPSVILAFAGSQFFLMARIGMILALLGGQLSLFESEPKLL